MKAPLRIIGAIVAAGALLGTAGCGRLSRSHATPAPSPSSSPMEAAPAATKESIMKEAPATESRRANHLSGQTSPYLLQHLYNPVDWYSWGAEALAKARREGKPIFLSIGYAACHWCHVMEHESFENEQIAAFLNANFVPIKVDREERPDLDEIYMNAVQLMTGSGGWPLSAWLTPALEPFYGGTYFPPDDRYGRPGFLTVLQKLHEAWTTRRVEIERSAGQMTQHLIQISVSTAAATGTEMPGREALSRAAAELAARFDPTWGGFGGAPKFPPHGALGILIREHARSGEKVPREMAERTLDRMARGGMYDQVGGGFHRYSTDEKWLVPHFEKMLYDQALLVPVYLDAWLVTRRPLYRRVVEETLDFVRREMTHPDGGFYSSLDADSEGEEGKFYVWTRDEVLKALGPERGDLFCRVYGIRAEGNFEGKSIPAFLEASLEEQARQMGLTEAELLARLAPMRAKLLETRGRRVLPGTDDKVLTAWNGLMITAAARAYQALGRPEDLASARRAADFVLTRLSRDGRLLVAWREGKAQVDGFLDDHAFLARGLVDLYEASFEPRWLEEGARVARRLLDLFEDKDRGSFYFTATHHENLLVRTRTLHDGALPSGAGVAVEALLRLGLHLDDAAFREAGHRALRAAREVVEKAPSALASHVVAADFVVGPAQEIAIVGPPEDPATRALLETARDRYLPNRIIALAAPGAASDKWPLLRGKTQVGGKPAAYVCRQYVCQAPTTDPAALARLIR